MFQLSVSLLRLVSIHVLIYISFSIFFQKRKNGFIFWPLAILLIYFDSLILHPREMIKLNRITGMQITMLVLFMILIFQVKEPKPEFFQKQSELFESEVYLEEVADVLCIAQAGKVLHLIPCFPSIQPEFRNLCHFCFINKTRENG